MRGRAVFVEHFDDDPSIVFEGHTIDGPGFFFYSIRGTKATRNPHVLTRVVADTEALVTNSIVLVSHDRLITVYTMYRVPVLVFLFLQF